MNVRELITKMEGVKSYGVYSNHGDNPHPTTQELMKYLDEEVEHFELSIFDAPDTANYAYIRCCIYLED